jgi:hypothetical protein
VHPHCPPPLRRLLDEVEWASYVVLTRRAVIPTRRRVRTAIRCLLASPGPDPRGNRHRRDLRRHARRRARRTAGRVMSTMDSLQYLAVLVACAAATLPLESM